MKIKKYSDINEQNWLWDKGNEKALKSYINKDKKIYKIEVGHPFVITTTDSSDFYKLRFIFKTHNIDFREEIKDP